MVHQNIVNEELVLARAPALIGLMGIQMVGPTLIQCGTESTTPALLAEHPHGGGDLVPGLFRSPAPARTLPR